MLLRGCAGRLASEYQHKFCFEIHSLNRKNGQINYAIFLMFFRVLKKQ